MGVLLLGRGWFVFLSMTELGLVTRDGLEHLPRSEKGLGTMGRKMRCQTCFLSPGSTCFSVVGLCPTVEEGVRRQLLYRLRKGEGFLEEVSLVLCLGEGMKECKYGKELQAGVGG